MNNKRPLLISVALLTDADYVQDPSQKRELTLLSIKTNV